ncbi:MAG: hypothetical protein QOF52_2106 [Propionibacteriaceae bacterium]|jgi:hypothetical protein|nr:hypothetical protein [Propionibacteriaceae bacterium]MDX6322248.1 hypothetical protein [Propionibacteriaceae bacterium]
MRELPRPGERRGKSWSRRGTPSAGRASERGCGGVGLQHGCRRRRLRKQSLNTFSWTAVQPLLRVRISTPARLFHTHTLLHLHFEALFRHLGGHIESLHRRRFISSDLAAEVPRPDRHGVPFDADQYQGEQGGGERGPFADQVVWAVDSSARRRR